MKFFLNGALFSLFYADSSGRPSALKIITFVLIGSAFLITSAAIRQAYY